MTAPDLAALYTALAGLALIAVALVAWGLRHWPADETDKEIWP